MEQIIFSKLFSAFTAIIIKVIKTTDLDDTTKTMLNENLSSICNVLLDVNKPKATSETSLDSQPAPSMILRKRKSDEPVEPVVVSKRGRSTNNQQTKSSATKKALSTNSKEVSVDENAQEITPNLPTTTRSLTEPTAQQATLDHPPVNDLELELVAIVPEKKVFLSNLPSETTVKAIQNHLERKIPNFDVETIRVKKLDTKPDRNYALFVVNVKDNVELFAKLINSDMWPPHCIVHEFNTNRRKSNFRMNGRFIKRK